MAKSGKGKKPVVNEALPTEGDDNLNGSNRNDTLDGLSGNDTLRGGNGNDTLYGGSGDDKLQGDNGSDTLYGDDGEDELSGGNAKDTLYGGADNDELDGGNGNDTLYGDEGDDELSGGNGVDTLYGGAGNDELDGGRGGDNMIGGEGDDTYIVDSKPDKITELADEGEDTVKTSLATFTLASNLENLEYTGSRNFTGTGNELDNEIEGGNGKDKLYGLDGDDELHGEGGNDMLYGGKGNDELDGGSGADTMTGGLGDDTYVVDNLADVIVENPGEGNDTVETSLSSFTLSANVENLVYTGSGDFTGTGDDTANGLAGGDGNDMLYGMGGDDTLQGGAGNDLLDGGSGADAMSGGAGDDTYIVDDAGDTVTELADEGLDTVQTSLASYTLGDNVENLTYTGAGSFSGTGNALANGITGGSGDDTLTGLAGDDTLTGGLGNDILDGGLGLDIINGGDGMDTILLHALGGVDGDIVSDFVVADDQFALSQIEFVDVLDGDVNGVLDAGLFEVGAAATLATTRIVYDDATGAVMYDADGNGAGAAVTIAQVSTGLLINSDDFNVI